MKCKYPFDLVIKGVKQTVACGRCIACRVNRTTEWTTRILHERRCHRDSIFITLTYAPENLPPNGSLCKRDLQLFFKRLRKAGLTFRYYACGEYGETYKRPHYHVILFGVHDTKMQLIKTTWGKGFIDGPGTVTEQSARYTARYVQKQLFGTDEEFYKKRNIEREFMLCSRRPGIGNRFAKLYIKRWTELGYISQEGVKKPVPKYYVGMLDDNERRAYSVRRELTRSMNLWRKGVKENKTQQQLWEEEYDKREQDTLDFLKKMELYNSKKF